MRSPIKSLIRSRSILTVDRTLYLRDMAILDIAYFNYLFLVLFLIAFHFLRLCLLDILFCVYTVSLFLGIKLSYRGSWPANIRSDIVKLCNTTKQDEYQSSRLRSANTGRLMPTIAMASYIALKHLQKCVKKGIIRGASYTNKHAV